jgi:hypothetical protein
MAAIEENILHSKLAWRCCQDDRRERNDACYVPGALLLLREDPTESAAGLTRQDFNEKAMEGVQARRCKTGYIQWWASYF